MKKMARNHDKFFAGAMLVSVLCFNFATRAEEVHLKLMSTGAMEKLGGYIPQKIELSDTKPAGLTKVPAGLTAPLYGAFKLGPAESPKTFIVVLDEPEGSPSHLYVDANGNGDLTDDAAAEWTPKPNKGTNGVEYTMYFGGVQIKVPFGDESPDLHVVMYRFDKKDPRRAALAKFLFYYGDYARSGEITLGSENYPALLPDRMTLGDFRGKKGEKQPPGMLLIDVNRDGKFDGRQEAFALDKPFNIGGTTYEFSGMTASGGSFQINKSATNVDETKPMASLTAGKPALAFEAMTTESNAVKFPETYKGKLVLLDFWATWCGPCVAELPHLTNAYEKFHPEGFEVLGISLDQENAGPKLAAFTKSHNMPWAQVYDGKYWSSAVAVKYNIQSIPHAFLVDGDTGVIIAEGESLRGEDLATAVAKALAKKKGG